MSSLNQLISEIAHSVQQADSVPVRRAIRQGIIHARNELIRHVYSNHNYVDKVLKQKFIVTIVDCGDNHLNLDIEDTNLKKLKKTYVKVPRPVRLSNNLPFHSIYIITPTEQKLVSYVTDSVNEFYKHLPGMSNTPTYDYINDYIYIYGAPEDANFISIESIFEYPHEFDEKYVHNIGINDDDEFFLPEDLVNSVKKLVLETFNNTVIRDTNEIPTPNLVK